MAQVGHSVSPAANSAATPPHSPDALKPVGPAIQWLARAGYAAKGIVYCLIGLFAVLAALGERGGQTTGQRGAIANLHTQPGGIFLACLLAVGLFGYALWSLVRGILDPEHCGIQPKGLAKRFAKFVKGIVYLGLVVAVIGMVTGRGQGGDGESNVHRWAATLMSLPLGPWLAIGAGVGIIVYGLIQLIKAWRINLDKMLDLSTLGRRVHRVIIHISRLGIATRGIVFGAICIAMIGAGLHSNPGEAKGVGGALRWLATQPYGPAILLITAVGLVAYGFYEFIRARYRIIRAPNLRPHHA